MSEVAAIGNQRTEHEEKEKRLRAIFRHDLGKISSIWNKLFLCPKVWENAFKRLSFWNVVILSESSLKCHPICVLINMTVSRTHKSSKAFKRKLSVIEPWKITGKRGNKDVIVSFVISLHWAEHNNTFWLVTTLDVQKKALLYKGGVGDRKCMLFSGNLPTTEVWSLLLIALELGTQNSPVNTKILAILKTQIFVVKKKGL